ncbi:protein phosphatase 1 regulatory subunit 26 [Hoplias malabaricus]|uniref:protein phosphatase 1 regulatory subunit 26 n=1 Tax=Hoplias malabaricus TaxID=27720 RepID=UPI003462987F
MFLKTVPPVLAVHSEWSSGKSFGLQHCFNDSASDSDFTTSSGTSLQRKVQMIIDSLRSTQSSDMSDTGQGNPQSDLDLVRHHRIKSRETEALPRSRWTHSERSKLQQTGLAAGESSDSDDSVDRGIEAAIQEYLKEKVEHQRKGEPVTTPPQTPQLSQRLPDPPKQLTHSKSNKVLTTSNFDQKGFAPVVTLKKKKKKKPSNENPIATEAFASSGAWKPSPSTPSSPAADRTPPRLQIKERELKEEDSLDSSSDDGIEEAIQRFQQEQKELHERSLHPREVLESSSDDGIEEAIRHFQQEKQKQEKPKTQPKQGPLMATQHIRVPILPVDCTGVQSNKVVPKKKNSTPNRKKSASERAAAEKEIKCASPKPLSLTHSLNISPAHSLKARGDALCTCTVRDQEPLAEQQIHSTLMVNTTAELMCAEAILDISKTVMPAAFEPNMNLSKNSLTEPPLLFPSALPLQPDKQSDESSVDSEDGIEQEIRKFLELKAKMHEQPTVTTATPVTSLAGVPSPKVPQKKKAENDQSKALRLSLSRKRKHKEEDYRSEKRKTTEVVFEESSQKPVPVTQSDTFTDVTSPTCPATSKHSKPKQNFSLPGHPDATVSTEKVYSSSSGSSPSAAKAQPRPKRIYSSDKSSSLDSDEDLDAAIKDLLKTKKKIKKKVRDMKLTARKRLNLSQMSETSKKPRPVTEQRSILSAKPSKETTVLMRQGQSAKPKALKPHETSKKPVDVAGDRMEDDPHSCICVNDDSSSVDSDDSIEQEIRKFLAEKAKVSNMPVVSVKEEDAKVGEEVASTFAGIGERDVKEEEMKVEVSQGLQRTNPQLEVKEPQETSAGSATMQRHVDTTAVKSKGASWSQSVPGIFARTSDEWRNGSLDAGKDQASFKEGTSSDQFVVGLMGSRDAQTQCQVQHQNLFLMKPENRSMTDVREATTIDVRDLPSGLQNRNRIPLREVISAVCMSPVAKAPLETPLAAKGERLPLLTPESKTDSFYLHSRVKKPHWDQPPILSPSVPHANPINLTPISRHLASTPPHLSPNPSHLSCTPLPPTLSQPRITASVVRLRRDQAAVIPLSPHKTNHLQLSNRQEERDKEKGRMNDGREEEEEEEERREEESLDETDIESGEERRAVQQRIDKKQQHSSHWFFSTSIDPGELASPYIALNSAERKEKFRHLQQLQVRRIMKSMTQKLQFVVSLSR